MRCFFLSVTWEGKTFFTGVASVCSGETNCLSHPCEITASSLLWVVALHCVSSFSDPIWLAEGGGGGAGVEYEEEHILCIIEVLGSSPQTA